MADILTEGSFIRDEGNHDLCQVNIMSNSMFSSSHLRSQIKDPRTMSKRPNEIVSAVVLLFFSPFFCKCSSSTRTCGFPKCRTRSLTLIWSLRGRMQSQSLGKRHSLHSDAAFPTLPYCL